MKKLLIVIGILVVVALITGNMYVSTRNELVRKNETINAAWSQVDVVLQRRPTSSPTLSRPSRAMRRRR